MLGEPKLSISEFTTFPASFDEDLVAYREAGAQGIGVCEVKIARDPAAAAKLRRSELAATVCVPAVASILAGPRPRGPSQPEARVELICESVRRLSELEPACCFFLTGPRGDRDDHEARRLVCEGIAAIEEAAERAGVRVALEPIHSSQVDLLSLVDTVPGALALLEEAGARSVGILFDAWNLWDTPDLHEHIRAHVNRIFAVHVADRREPTRSPYDRVFPGEGVSDVAGILRSLRDAGYDGWYDVEVFSDNGGFGSRLPDSLWDLDASEVARRACASFGRVWRQSENRSAPAMNRPA